MTPLSARARQAWTVAKIELRRAFFARRSFWVYGLALLPAVIFFGHGLEAKFRSERLTRRGLITAAQIDGVQVGESIDDVKKRLGKPGGEMWSTRTRRVRQRTGNAGTTTHVIEPAVDTRFVRLNVARPSYDGEPVARIYEFEVYGPDGRVNLALHRPTTGSLPCRPDQGPEKAVNGSVAGGQADSWCADDWPLFLQVDLGAIRPVTRFIVKHASAGGENEEADTREFNIQLSPDGKTFTTVATSTGAGFVEQRTELRDQRGRGNSEVVTLMRHARGPSRGDHVALFDDLLDCDLDVRKGTTQPALKRLEGFGSGRRSPRLAESVDDRVWRHHLVDGTRVSLVPHLVEPAMHERDAIG